MAFWGVEVKAGKPFTLKATESTGTRRLHLSQATSGIGNATNRSIVQCNVGNKSPLYLCILSPDKVESCQLNLEFEEADDVIFSVIGPRSVHLTGYFLARSTAFRPNDDESESYGEDIADTDVEKGSSDDYDYSDSFINDADPSARGSHLSSTDDDEISIKEMAAKTKDKKKKGKGGRLRKTYVVVDSDSDETSARADDSSNGDSVQVLENDNDQKKAKVLSSECPLPSRVTRSKARSSTLENVEPDAECEKTSEARTNTDKTLDERREDHPAGDVNLSPLEKGSEVLSKKKKKKKKRDRSEETAHVEKNNSECPKRKKQAIDKNIEKEAGTKKPLESEISSNEVVVEDIEKGNLDGKAAVKGKRVSIHYTAKLKDTGKVFESNLGEAPLRFRLGGDKVIEGLSIGVEGMRVGDKRRLTIPPSLGFSEERLKEGVPKDAWLVYEVERVKIK